MKTTKAPVYIKYIRIAFLYVFIISTLTYAVLTAGFYFYQEKLIFYPQPLNEQVVQAQEQENKNIENISINTSDNNTLNGWLVKSTIKEKAPLIIYFGGNADEVSNMIPTANMINDWNWALVNYRGYGTSTGEPNETNLFNDSKLIYDHLKTRNDIDSDKVILFGRSLGTGVAVYLAEEREVEGLILVTPYDSITSVAQDLYPVFPMNFLVKNKFDSISRAGNISVPTLVLAAQNDEVIPLNHTEKLVKSLNGKCDFKIIENTGHGTISDSPLYLGYIVEFLDSYKD